MVDINFRNGYFYGVCLIAIILFIFASVTLVNSIIDYAYPTKSTSFHSISEQKLRYKKKYPELSQEEISELIKQKKETEKESRDQRRKKRVILELARSITIIGLVIPIYLFHWRRVEGS